MNSKSNPSRLLRTIIELRGKVYLKLHLRNLENIQKIQKKVLLKKVRRNKDSEFGKKYSFSQIKTVKKYQENLPLFEYDQLSPYIEKTKSGNLSALFGPKERIVMYALTSGTTGSVKYIPVTSTFLKEYKKGSKLWASSVVIELSGRTIGKALPLFSQVEEEKTSSGISCGAVSGLIAKNQGKLVSRFFAAPYEACRFHSSNERLYAFLRAGAEQSVSILTTANPSTIIQFAKILEDKGEQLVSDLEEGTLNGKKAPFPLRKIPDKAKRLRKILKQQGKLKPRDLWPNFQVITCWKGGTLFHYIETIYEIYGKDIYIKDIGLLASEGRFSLPIFPGSDDGLLNIFHHFFEFIEESEEDFDNPKTLLAHELEQGKRYFLVITTSSGLYRYKLHDLIEVTGFFRKVPLIHFLNKGKHIASLTGEKITENQVTRSLYKVARDFRMKASHFRFFPRFDDIPYYMLYIEKEDEKAEVTEKFMNDLDGELQSQNIEYASKRASGRLKRLETFWVKKGTFSDKQKQSHRIEQYKPVYLNPDPNGYLEYEKNIIE
jgi:hypothetical protein